MITLQSHQTVMARMQNSSRWKLKTVAVPQPSASGMAGLVLSTRKQSLADQFRVSWSSQLFDAVAAIFGRHSSRFCITEIF